MLRPNGMLTLLKVTDAITARFHGDIPRLQEVKENNIECCKSHIANSVICDAFESFIVSLDVNKIAQKY